MWKNMHFSYNFLTLKIIYIGTLHILMAYVFYLFLNTLVITLLHLFF